MNNKITNEYVESRTKELNFFSTKIDNIYDILANITEDFPLQRHHKLVLEDEDFKGTILDIGSHFCVFDIVAKLKDQTRTIYCLDGSEIACTIGEKLKQKSGADINILCSLTEQEQYEENMFDCITIIQTLEHINDMDKLFLWIDKILKPTGTLYISVPYQKSHYDPDHCNFFDTKNNESYINILQLLKNKGYIANGYVYKSFASVHADIFLKCIKEKRAQWLIMKS